MGCRKRFGRYLKPVVRYKSGKKKGKIKEHGELVHHIDMDKRNNDISNLMICNGMGHHQDIHATYNDVCASLMKKGIIGFNKETEEYEKCAELVKIKDKCLKKQRKLDFKLVQEKDIFKKLFQHLYKLLVAHMSQKNQVLIPSLIYQQMKL